MLAKFAYTFLALSTLTSFKVVGQTDSCKSTSLYSILFSNERGDMDSCAGFCDYPDIRCENPSYVISEFDVLFENSNQKRQIHDNDGPSFNLEIRSLIKNAQKGSIISFIYIKAKSKLDGKTYFLKPRTIDL